MSNPGDRELYELYYALGKSLQLRGRPGEAADGFALALYYARRIGDGALVRTARASVLVNAPDHVAARELSAPLFFAQLLIRYPVEHARRILQDDPANKPAPKADTFDARNALLLESPAPKPAVGETKHAEAPKTAAPAPSVPKAVFELGANKPKPATKAPASPTPAPKSGPTMAPSKPSLAKTDTLLATSQADIELPASNDAPPLLTNVKSGAFAGGESVDAFSGASSARPTKESAPSDRPTPSFGPVTFETHHPLVGERADSPAGPLRSAPHRAIDDRLLMAAPTPTVRPAREPASRRVSWIDTAAALTVMLGLLSLGFFANEIYVDWSQRDLRQMVYVVYKGVVDLSDQDLTPTEVDPLWSEPAQPRSFPIVIKPDDGPTDTSFVKDEAPVEPSKLPPLPAAPDKDRAPPLPRKRPAGGIEWVGDESAGPKFPDNNHARRKSPEAVHRK